MNATPLHIKVTSQERKFISLLAARLKLSTTALVKKALVAYADTPPPADAMTEALEKLERFSASDEQIARHRAVKQDVDGGRRKGLNRDDSLALLAKLQRKARDPRKNRGEI